MTRWRASRPLNVRNRCLQSGQSPQPQKQQRTSLIVPSITHPNMTAFTIYTSFEFSHSGGGGGVFLPTKLTKVRGST